jgi:hypothetical protein
MHDFKVKIDGEVHTINIVDFKYQPELTKELDDLNSGFDQDIINEIVLWKVNRYAPVRPQSLALLNKIKKSGHVLNIELTREVLFSLLDDRGIALAMASTILRFKNPDVYQIIDQRVYRYLYGELPQFPKRKDEIIELYIQYLHRLRLECDKQSIAFCDADRLFYMADKKMKKYENLNNYGSKQNKDNG